MPRVMVVRHAAHEALGNLETVLRASGLELEVVNAFDGDWIAIDRRGFRSRDYLGLVIMGGPMNVDQTDRYPYLAAEVEWLRAAVADELPTLGVCLGAQLLAKAAGAESIQARSRKSAGTKSSCCRRPTTTSCWPGTPRAGRVPVARRHIRPTRGGSPAGHGHVVPPPGDPLRPASVGLAVSLGNDRRDGRDVAGGPQHVRRAGTSALHRRRRDPPPRARPTGGPGAFGLASIRPLRHGLPAGRPLTPGRVNEPHAIIPADRLRTGLAVNLRPDAHSRFSILLDHGRAEAMA